MKKQLFYFQIDLNPKKNGKAIYSLILLLNSRNNSELEIKPIENRQTPGEILGLEISGEEESANISAERLRKYLRDKRISFKEERSNADIKQASIFSREAEEMFKKELKKVSVNPDEKYESEIQKNLKSAINFFDLGMIKESVRMFEQVLLQDEINSQAHYYLGLIYEQKDELEKAVMEYQKAIDSNPDNGLIYF